MSDQSFHVISYFFLLLYYIIKKNLLHWKHPYQVWLGSPIVAVKILVASIAYWNFLRAPLVSCECSLCTDDSCNDDAISGAACVSHGGVRTGEASFIEQQTLVSISAWKSLGLLHSIAPFYSLIRTNFHSFFLFWNSFTFFLSFLKHFHLFPFFFETFSRFLSSLGSCWQRIFANREPVLSNLENLHT